MSNDALLVFTTPARRRDDIVDTLMGFEAISGFSVTDVAGYSRGHSRFNLRERVQGFGDYERFEVLCDAPTRQALLVVLAEVAGRDHLRYWVTPVLEEGAVGAQTPIL